MEYIKGQITWKGATLLSMKKHTKGENIFNFINILFFIFCCAITIYPFVNAMAISFSSPVAVAGKIITVFPKDFNLESYKICFGRKDIPLALLISILRTVLGTLLHIIVTGMAAYAISIKTLPFRKPITLFLLVPMYLSSGLIPYFITIHDLKLMNNFLVYILPSAFVAYDMLIMRTFFESIPQSLTEYATIDGASNIKIFTRIILPLSKPIFAAIALFAGVGQWNSWFDALQFVTNTKLHPLSMLLQRILMANQIVDARSAMNLARQKGNISPQGIKMAILIITTVPIIFIYPFFQRYFVKGVMIGAVKE